MPMMLKRAVHPGEVLLDELQEAGVTPAEFAAQVELPVRAVDEIIGGLRPVDADAALRLGHWFGTNPQFWMNLQSHYDLLVAERETGRRISGLPVRAA